MWILFHFFSVVSAVSAMDIPCLNGWRSGECVDRDRKLSSTYYSSLEKKIIGVLRLAAAAPLVEVLLVIRV